MSYRRMGDGPRGGNRSFSQPFQSGPVNPWQGGNNTNQGGIISQLTSNPQLALALSSLLQPQQQQPPSLLSLNTAPAFSDRGDYGRFSMNRGREFRRPEPYYKQNNQNRGFGDRRRRSPKRGGDKRNDRKFDKKTEDKDKKQKDKEDGDVSMEDDESESKRDWKDEKNQTEGKESGDESEAKKKEGDKEGRFSGVPQKFLNCFVCNKQMWDGESMGKHLRGRAHQEMMKALEESIHICVDILRENMRLVEDRKVIEWNRQNRLKKFGKRPRDSELSHCNMCDLKFMGKIIGHRRTEGHQRLKNYLHPKCKVCDKEFPSRLEWIDHRLTPEHMRKLNSFIENGESNRDGHKITEGDGEDMDLDPLLNENLEMESEDAILELDTPLEGFQNRLPAYRPNRALASKSLKEFTGWMCEICNRSFSEEQHAQDHLKTRRHFYQFVEVLKKKFEDKERKEKAEKEDAEKKKKEDQENAENGEDEEVGEEEAEAEVADTDMYDPNEATEDKENGEAEEDESAETETKENVKENEQEEEEEEKVEPPKKEVKVESPKKEGKKDIAPVPKTPAKKLAGPKSKRGRK